MSDIIIVTESTFESEVLKSKHLTIVDFWAGWCGPSKMLSPILKELFNDYPEGLKIAQLNVDENLSLANDLGVKNIPTLLFYKNGEVADRIIGAMEKPFIIDKIRNLL